MKSKMSIKRNFGIFSKRVCAVLLAVITAISVLTTTGINTSVEVNALNTTLTSTVSEGSSANASWITYTKNGENNSLSSNTTSNRLEAHGGPSVTEENKYYYGEIAFTVEAKDAPNLPGYTFVEWSIPKINGSHISSNGTISSTITSGSSYVCSKFEYKSLNAYGPGKFDIFVYAISNGGNGNQTRQFTITADAVFSNIASPSITKTVTHTWKGNYYIQNTDGESTYYTITYDMNAAYGGVKAPNSQTKLKGTVIALTKEAAICKYGNTFLGWNTKPNGTGTSYAPGATYTADSNVTLYAQYQVTYTTINYYNNYPNGTNTLFYADTRAPEYMDYTIISDKPIYSGYEFIGWSLNDTTTVEYSSGQAAAFQVPPKAVGTYSLYFCRRCTKYGYSTQKKVVE